MYVEVLRNFHTGVNEQSLLKNDASKNTNFNFPTYFLAHDLQYIS